MVTARRRSRLAHDLQRNLIVQFVAGVPARMAAELVGRNRHSATLYHQKPRELIVAKLAAEAPLHVGEVEVDKSCFGGVRKGKRGRRAAGQVPVFSLLIRSGKAYATMIADTRSQTLVGIIRQHIQPDSVVYTDSYRSYDVPDVSEFHHQRINHGQAFMATGNHINGVENVWNQAKRHLRRYDGTPKVHFEMFLQRREWRCNYRPQAVC